MDKKPLSHNEILESIAHITEKYLRDSKIILFGSRAGNTNRENSDYDIAIIWKEKIPAQIYFAIQEDLDNLYTLKTIDLVDFYNLDEDFKEIVIKEGFLLYDGTNSIKKI
ncbi:MAG: nucleotidyltransferase domain-containing protein [Candidatus Eremiobacterota bacterium]